MRSASAVVGVRHDSGARRASTMEKTVGCTGPTMCWLGLGPAPGVGLYC
jgi:hypothetical protein